MKTARIIADLCVLVSTTWLLILIGDFKISGIAYDSLINVALQVMHFSLIIAIVLNCIRQIKAKQWVEVGLTLLPGLCFIIALAGVLLKFSFPGISLFIFDFYLVYYFFYLLIGEFKTDNCIKN